MDNQQIRRAGVLWVAIFVVAALGTSPAWAEDTFWHVKGIHPKGYFLDIKAADADGNLYDIKAIQQGDNVHMLDVKAIVGDRRVPVKVVVSDSRHAAVQALGIRGSNLDLVAVTPEGKFLPVKAVRRTGSILHIKVLGIGGRWFGVKAISPMGRMFDIKGIKMSTDRVEMMIQSVKVHAHVKALPPAGDL